MNILYIRISKSANRSAAQSDHSSLSDSQFLFSSQFCPDNSQQGSMDYTTPTKYQKNSNQSFQDVSNVKFRMRYAFSGHVMV